MTPMFYEVSLGAKVAEQWGRLGSADDELLDDPGALEAAQRAANAEDPEAVYAEMTEDWVPVFGPSKLSGIIDVAGFNASFVTMPLAAEGISYAWSPYPPEEMPGAAYPNEHLLDRPFTLLVARPDAQHARELISEDVGSRTLLGIPSTHQREPAAAKRRRVGAWVLFLVFVGVDLIAFLGYGLYALLRRLH